MKAANPKRFQMPAMLKNILIGTFTTVAASAIIWFLGLNNNKTNEKERQKEATYKSLETLGRYEITYLETIDDINCRLLLSGKTAIETEDGEMVIRQMANNINTLTDLKNEPDIDIDMKALIQRRLSYYGAIKTEYEKLLEKLAALGNDSSQLQAKTMISNKFQNTVAETSLMEEQPTKNLMASIEKKYGQKIKGVHYKQEIIPQNLYGKWRFTSTLEVSLQNDGTVNSIIDNENFKGNWELKADTILIQYTDGDTDAFVLNSISKKTMLYNLPGDIKVNYACRY